ncbi:hypothetical protein [Methylotuvimicrobium sp. KM1]|uniref:hypothetical protein n=1 Tax=Methylotuvimicrobium sp. KM1 TaxID=3377707 RepID=UPI00384C9219
MAIEWTPILVAAASGLGAGIVGSLVAPWAQWKIEETRERASARRKFIESCRTLIASEISSQEFRETPEYARLRPHLSERVRMQIESDTIHIQMGGRGGGANNFAPKLLDEIATLEKKWKLI